MVLESVVLSGDIMVEAGGIPAKLVMKPFAIWGVTDARKYRSNAVDQLRYSVVAQSRGNAYLGSLIGFSIIEGCLHHIVGI